MYKTAFRFHLNLSAALALCAAALFATGASGCKKDKSDAKGGDKSAQAGHDHGDHAGHDHGDHAGHDHGDHAGHDHGDHAGHDHGDHAGHDHGDHAGHDHGDHAGHDHGDHAGHHAARKGAPAKQVKVPAKGKKFDPPIQPEQLPEGGWYCDMGTVHYARGEKGDGKCPLCMMRLKQKK